MERVGRRELIALVKDSTVHVLDRDGKTIKSIAVAEVYGRPIAVFITPDGMSLAYQCDPASAGKKSALVLFDMTTGLERVIAAGNEEGYFVGEGWSPDGERFAFVDGHEDRESPMLVFERKTGRTRTLHKDAPCNPVWARDSSALYSANSDAPHPCDSLGYTPAGRMTEKQNDPRAGRLHPISDKDASDVFKSLGVPRMTEQEVRELKDLKQELDVASQIQRKLLPEKIPEVAGYEFDTVYSPAGKLSGDFYDFIPFDRNRIGILVADASGKGLSGSLLMVEARAVICGVASMTSSPREILVQSNRVLLRDLQRGMFITIVFALLDVQQGALKIASAGHMPMLLRRNSVDKCFAVNPSGLILGAANEQMFTSTLKEETVALHPGDRFVLYTDGVTELMNVKEDEFGKSRLVRSILQYGQHRSQDFLQALMADLELHRCGHPQSDDITIVTGRRLPETNIWPEDEKPDADLSSPGKL